MKGKLVIQVASVLANTFYLIAGVAGLMAILAIFSAFYAAGNRADPKSGKHFARAVSGGMKAYIAWYFFLNVANAMIAYIAGLPR